MCQLSKLYRWKLSLILVLTLVVMSCKKDISVDSDQETDSYTLLSRDMTVSSQEVIEWLQTQMDSTTEVKNEFIYSILNQTDFGNMWWERYTDETTLIIAPIRPVYFSQHVDSGKEPLQYLILWETSGNIDRCEVVLFYPENPAFEGFIEGDFQYMYGGSVCETDGKFEMVNLSDRKELEIEYSSGKPTTSVTTLIDDKHEARENCTYITVVRWYFNTSYEITGYDVIWEGEVCGEDCLPGEINCDLTSNGSGGWGQPDLGVAMTPQLRFLVDRRQTGSNMQELQAQYNATGTRFINRTRNVFTTVIPNGVPALYFIGGSFFQLEASELGNGHPWFAEWFPIANNVTIQAAGTQAGVYVSGNIHYPNRNPASNPFAYPPIGVTNLIGNGHIFHAKDY